MASYKPKYNNLRDAYEEFKALKQGTSTTQRPMTTSGKPQGNSERRYINIQSLDKE